MIVVNTVQFFIIVVLVCLALSLAGCNPDDRKPPLTQHQVEIIRSCPNGFRSLWDEYLTADTWKVHVECDIWEVE